LNPLGHIAWAAGGKKKPNVCPGSRGGTAKFAERGKKPLHCIKKIKKKSLSGCRERPPLNLPRKKKSKGKDPPSNLSGEGDRTRGEGKKNSIPARRKPWLASRKGPDRARYLKEKPYTIKGENS